MAVKRGARGGVATVGLRRARPCVRAIAWRWWRRPAPAPRTRCAAAPASSRRSASRCRSTSASSRRPAAIWPESAALRAAHLQEAFADPSVAGIVCVRGGYGSAQILPLLDADGDRGVAQGLRRLQRHHRAAHVPAAAGRPRDLPRPDARGPLRRSGPLRPRLVRPRRLRHRADGGDRAARRSRPGAPARRPACWSAARSPSSRRRWARPGPSIRRPAACSSSTR